MQTTITQTTSIVVVPTSSTNLQQNNQSTNLHSSIKLESAEQEMSKEANILESPFSLTDNSGFEDDDVVDDYEYFACASTNLAVVHKRKRQRHQ